MPKPIAALLPTLLLFTGCTRAEPATVAALESDMAGNVDRVVRLEGQVVRPSSSVTYVSIGNNYFALRDGTGTINVWYGPGMRCEPRRGSRVSVVGKVMKPENASFHIFASTRIKIESSPPLGENEVRLCSLSNEENRIFQMEGPESLQEYWRRRGEPVRDVVTN